MAMGQGPLTASNSCACFNRNSSQLPSAKCLEAETAELIIFMLRYGPQGHEPFTKIIFSETIARPFGDLLGKYQGSLSSVAGGLLKISRMAGRAARIAVAMISGSDIPSARQLTR